ncbi:hypothetical protein BESB_059030 [Besnoitia besnoiti]|uniref:Transmembrane protein n=1 Tax=Besnoitia besnoiti TaxID=94643 RepID=A0A2A9MGC0_BESBE|nr:hypothetical protein BESB_059030 [Besnoitia besnoiti]PFH35016.1 hypothetical protein BESB_059030 [Besnoitia besnoiti]
MAPSTDGAVSNVQPWRNATRGFGSRFAATASWLTLSTVTVAFLITPRKKEWVDICLDYCYSKRALSARTIYDGLFAFLKKMPK